MTPREITAILERSLTQSGESLAILSDRTPLLVVFLRQAGCIFCREALADLARARSAIEQQGTRIVLVHMGDTKAVEELLLKYGLPRIDRICDPQKDLYRAFGLGRGRFQQLFGFQVIWRSSLLWFRYGIGWVSADPAQLPGVFLIAQSTVVRRFRHRTPADRPDYLALSA